MITLPDIVIEAQPIPYQSAPAEEIIDLTRACPILKGQVVNISTDSIYAFGVAHNFRGVVTLLAIENPSPILP